MHKDLQEPTLQDMQNTIQSPQQTMQDLQPQQTNTQALRAFLDNNTYKEKGQGIEIGENTQNFTLQGEAKTIPQKIEIPINPQIQNNLNLTEASVKADLEKLQSTHPEIFKSKGAVARLINKIQENPTFFFNNNRLDMQIVGSYIKNHFGELGIVTQGKNAGEVGHILKAEKAKNRINALAKREVKSPLVESVEALHTLQNGQMDGMAQKSTFRGIPLKDNPLAVEPPTHYHTSIMEQGDGANAHSLKDNIDSTTNQTIKQEASLLEHIQRAATNIREEEARKQASVEQYAKKVADEIRKGNIKTLNTKITSKKTQEALDNLPVATQDEYKDFIDKAFNGDFKSIPEVIKVSTLNQSVKKMLGVNNANVFLSRKSAGHMNPSRKEKFHQDLTRDEYYKIQNVINATQEILKEKNKKFNNTFSIAFDDLANASKTNMLHFAYDDSGNFILTAQKVSREKLKNYEVISARGGVEPPTPLQKNAVPFTENKASLADTNNNSTTTLTQSQKLYQALDRVAPTLADEARLKNLNPTLKEAQIRFTLRNKDKENKELFNKVIVVAQQLGVKFENKGKALRGELGHYDAKANVARIFTEGQAEAETILHELIHSVTSRALKADDTLLTPLQKEAIKDIKETFNTLSKDKNLQGQYALHSPDEMLAELANKDFRKALQGKNLWERILNALSKLFFKNQGNYENLKQNLHKLMENYSKDFTQNYNVKERTIHNAYSKEQKEQRGIYNVTYNNKRAVLIRKDLETADEALAVYTKGHIKKRGGKGAKHIAIRHLKDTSKEGYITDLELVNMGKSMREYIQKHKEPFIQTLEDGRKAHIYEWEKDKVRFRVVVEHHSSGGTHLHAHPSDENIITFYSDRNLKEPMQFKNPAVEKDYSNKNPMSGLLDRVRSIAYRQKTQEKLQSIVGKPIINSNDGRVAQISKKNIAKMTSDKAIAKSVANGFSEIEHFKAVQDIENLYKKAIHKETHRDLKNNDPAILVHRYIAESQNGNALITLKESLDKNQNRIYSLELESLEPKLSTKTHENKHSTLDSTAKDFDTSVDSNMSLNKTIIPKDDNIYFKLHSQLRDKNFLLRTYDNMVDKALEFALKSETLDKLGFNTGFNKDYMRLREEVLNNTNGSVKTMVDLNNLLNARFSVAELRELNRYYVGDKYDEKIVNDELKAIANTFKEKITELTEIGIKKGVFPKWYKEMEGYLKRSYEKYVFKEDGKLKINTNTLELHKEFHRGTSKFVSQSTLKRMLENREMAVS